MGAKLFESLVYISLLHDYSVGECKAKDGVKLKSNDTVDGVGILGMKLLDELSKTSEDNIICSPFSIATTMAMVRFLYKYISFTCPFVSNKRQNGLTDRAQISCGTSHDPREVLLNIKIGKENS